MPASEELISILMPVKNAGLFLQECLDSILSQTESNWELLAVNDGSNDDSFHILSEYSRKDDRIHVFTSSGKGIIDALNLAYVKSKGKLITRMDADDRMVENKLEILKGVLLKQGKLIVATGMIEYFSSEKLGKGYRRYAEWLNRLCAMQNHYTGIYKECVIPSPCWMVWKEDMDAAGAFHESVYPEDYDLCFRFYKAGLKVVGIPEVLHFWRDHPSRSSRTLPQYLDQFYLNLKLDYFLKLDYNPELPLFLWGAGKKAKKVARKLAEKSIPFSWITNNQKKTGHIILGVCLQHFTELDSFNSGQIIIAVAGPDDQKEIRNYLENLDADKKMEYWFFV